MCNKKLFGRLSLYLAVIALLLGLVALIQTNVVIGILYGAFFVASPFVIAYFYCRKCPSNGNQCPHGVLGKIAKLYSLVDCSRYTKLEIAIVVLTIIFLIIIPQFALIKFIWLLVAFWILMIVAVVIIIKNLCPNCDNENCPICLKIKDKH